MSLKALSIAAMTVLSLMSSAMSPAMAATLGVVVRDASGAPVTDAVVTFTPAAGAAISAEDRKGPFIMAQKGVQFSPRVLVVPVGATVNFPNFDHVNHHVYSFSQTKTFQLPLYGFKQSRTITFDKAGAVALGCNIHDQMSAYIRVVSTPYYGRTDVKGLTNLNNLPAGKGTLSIWHPALIGPEVTQSVDPAGQTVNLSLKLRGS